MSEDAAVPQEIGSRCWRCGLPIGVLIVAASYAPLVSLHIRRLWQIEQYRYFPLVLLAFGWLLWSRHKQFFRHPSPTQSNFRGRQSLGVAELPRLLGQAALYALAFTLFTGSVLLWSPWLAMVSAIMAIAAALLPLGAGGRSLLPVWLLLWLLIPLPFRWDEQLILWLQGVSSVAGSHLLDFLGYNHVLTTHVIEVPSHKFLVEEACSGVRSLFILVACAAMFVVWQRRPLVHSLLMLLGAAFWAGAINGVRVAAIVVLDSRTTFDISSGWGHELAGALLFALAVSMLLCTDRLLSFLLEPIPWIVDDESGETLEPSPNENSADVDDPDAGGSVNVRGPVDDIVASKHLPKMRRRRIGQSVVRGLFYVSCGVLGLAQLSPLVRGEGAGQILRNDFRVPDLGKDRLPTKIDGWTRVTFDKTTPDEDGQFGPFSDVWKFVKKPTTAIFSIDYPFIGWHRLIGCYLGQGWTATSRTNVVLNADEDAAQIPFVQVDLWRPSGETALLLFSQFDRGGRPLNPPAESVVSLSWWNRSIRDRLLKRMVALGFSTTADDAVVEDLIGDERSTYEIQMFLVDSQWVSPQERREQVHLFVELRNLLHEKLMETSSLER